jgi:hypothetical protein
MSSHESLGRSHFAQLYFQAAKIRQQELASFFGRFEEGPGGALRAEQVQAAQEMAAEIAEFLQRASTYMNEATHLGESRMLKPAVEYDGSGTP